MKGQQIQHTNSTKMIAFKHCERPLNVIPSGSLLDNAAIIKFERMIMERSLPH